MPLIKCPDCGREISARAVSCPACAAPLAGSTSAALVPSAGGINHHGSGDRIREVERHVKRIDRRSRFTIAVGSSVALLLGGGGALAWIQWARSERTDHLKRPIELLVLVREARARSLARELEFRRAAGDASSEELVLQAANGAGEEMSFRGDLDEMYERTVRYAIEHRTYYYPPGYEPNYDQGHFSNEATPAVPDVSGVRVPESTPPTADRTNYNVDNWGKHGDSSAAEAGRP